MKNKKFVFAGNRYFVLEKMIALGLCIEKIYALKDSWLEKRLLREKINFTQLPEKEAFIQEIKSTPFDYFISNGLPYILPVSGLEEGTTKRFINLHPSFLPDLKGADPQPAALLFGRNSGASCHLMNDAIDAGALIAQEKIEYCDRFDAGLLYQLTFKAEQNVFVKAFRRDFKPVKEQNSNEVHIYYTFNNRDLIIDFTHSTKAIIRKVKAFNTPNKMARFIFFDTECFVQDADLIQNAFMDTIYAEQKENQVVMIYQENIVIKRKEGFLLLKHLKRSGGLEALVDAQLR